MRWWLEWITAVVSNNVKLTNTKYWMDTIMGKDRETKKRIKDKIKTARYNTGFVILLKFSILFCCTLVSK